MKPCSRIMILSVILYIFVFLCLTGASDEREKETEGDWIPDKARQSDPEEEAVIRKGPLEDVNFHNPRSGPGAMAFHELAKCLDENNHECLDEVFHGGEMAVRRVRDILDSGSIAIEREGTVKYYRKIAMAGGQERYRDLFMRGFEDCRVSLLAASRGRCDDTGWIEAPPPPTKNVNPDYSELIEGLWRDIAPDEGVRRARRIVCGVMRIGGRFVAEEVTVIFSEDESGLSVQDVKCIDVEREFYRRKRAKLDGVETQSRKWPPDDPDDAGALIALKQGVECLADRGGPCIAATSPLPGILVRDLMLGLDGRGEAAVPALINRARETAMDSNLRSRRLVTITPNQCSHVPGLPDIQQCTVSGHSEGKPEILLPENLPPAYKARVRAVAALTWGPTLEMDIRTSSVVCPSPLSFSTRKEELNLDLVWARNKSGTPVLLDIICLKNRAERQ